MKGWTKKELQMNMTSLGSKIDKGIGKVKKQLAYLGSKMEKDRPDMNMSKIEHTSTTRLDAQDEKIASIDERWQIEENE